MRHRRQARYTQSDKEIWTKFGRRKKNFPALFVPKTARRATNVPGDFGGHAFTRGRKICRATKEYRHRKTPGGKENPWEKAGRGRDVPAIEGCIVCCGAIEKAVHIWQIRSGL
jgi:hypothetical protein